MLLPKYSTFRYCIRNSNLILPPRLPLKARGHSTYPTSSCLLTYRPTKNTQKNGFFWGGFASCHACFLAENGSRCCQKCLPLGGGGGGVNYLAEVPRRVSQGLCEQLWQRGTEIIQIFKISLEWMPTFTARLN